LRENSVSFLLCSERKRPQIGCGLLFILSHNHLQAMIVLNATR